MTGMLDAQHAGGEHPTAAGVLAAAPHDTAGRRGSHTNREAHADPSADPSTDPSAAGPEHHAQPHAHQPHAAQQRTPPRLAARGVGAQLGGNTVLSDVDLDVRPGEVHGLVGPNGSGKTTLLRCCYRALSPTHGDVVLDGRDIRTVKRRDLAGRVGVSTQEPSALGGLTVRESVQLGRTARRGWLEPARREDDRIVDRVLEQVGLTEYADRDTTALSGGERQRVSIARALAQRPHVLLLDEPTNHLDLRHQLTVLSLLRTLAAEGLAVVVTLHDLRLAAEYCDRLTVLDDGAVRATGSVEQALGPELLADVFGVRGRVRSVGDRRTLDVTGLAGEEIARVG